jgi:hypothetical protein
MFYAVIAGFAILFVLRLRGAPPGGEPMAMSDLKAELRGSRRKTNASSQRPRARASR